MKVTVTEDVTVVNVNSEEVYFKVLVKEGDDVLAEKFALEAKASAEAAEDSAISAALSEQNAFDSEQTATTQAGIATTKAQEASISASNALASEQSAEADAMATAADRVQTGLDVIATTADRVQTGLDVIATAADRVQTGLDAIATAADRVQTGLDAQATAADRIQTGLDASTATAQAGIATVQAGDALISANNAAASASTAASAALNTPLTGFTTGANTTILSTDTTLEAFGKAQGQINARVSGTGASGQVAFWNGTGSQTGDSGLTWDNTTKSLTIDTSFIGFSNAILNIKAGSFSSFIEMSGANSLINGQNNLRFRVGGIDFVRIFSTGNIVIQNAGTFTDAGFRLDVNGTARVQGALTTNLTAGRVPFIGTGGVLSDDSGLRWDNIGKRLFLGSNLGTILTVGTAPVTQTGAITYGETVLIGTSKSITNLIRGNLDINCVSLATQDTGASLTFTNNVGSFGQEQNFVVASIWARKSNSTNTDQTTYLSFSTNLSGTLSEKWIIAGTGIFQSNGAQTIRTSTGDLTLATNGGNGNIILNPNGTGVISITDAKNLSFGTTTGTRLGTATNQRLSLWNATPNVQPTTAITAGAFVANTSGIANDTATFDGYTIGQVVAALRRIGALA